MIFDRDGNFVGSWGEGLFRFPHAIRILRENGRDVVWLCDEHLQQFYKFTTDGKLLQTIGERGHRSDTGVPPDDFASSAWQKVTHGGGPFNLPTDIAFAPSGEMFMTDGYGNARVHKYSPDGKLLMSWGEPGTDPGQFNIVHNICTDADGWVYVADRENHRVQVFDGNGKYEAQWNNLHRPCGLYMPYTHNPVCYIGELSVNRLNANLGPRVSIVDNQGKLLSRIGDPFAGTAPTSFIGPHGLAADSRGDLYVGEVCWTLWPGLFPGEPHPTNLRALQKYERIH